MKTIKVCDTTGTALDYLVAKCQGLSPVRDPMGFRTDAPHSILAGWWVDVGGKNMIVGYRKTQWNQHDGYSPTVEWMQGGPIMEELRGLSRHQFLIESDGDNVNILAWPTPHVFFRGYGPSLLVAVMRCYVTWHLGETAEIPDDLWSAMQAAPVQESIQ